MASTKKQERASKKYYDTHKKYREKKIEKQKAKQKANPSKHSKYQREYYKDNEDYRKYKRRYAKNEGKDNLFNKKLYLIVCFFKFNVFSNFTCII